jgi:hypothetical protein
LPQEVGGGVTVFRAAAEPSRAAADGIAAALEDEEEECDGIAMLVGEEEEEATGRDDAATAGPAASTSVAAPVDAEEGEAASQQPAGSAPDPQAQQQQV